MSLLGVFTGRQKELLGLEQDDERNAIQSSLSSLSAAQCEDEGLSILSLELDSVRTGLYGRTVVSLRRMNGGVLPQTSSFKVGDEVHLYAPRLQHTTSADLSSVTGVVTRCSSNGVEFVTEGEVDEELLNSSTPLRMDMLANEATHKKMMYALDDLSSQRSSDKCWPLVNLLVESNPSEVNLGLPTEMVNIEPILSGLNDTQIQAVEMALSSPYIAAIHGPPGTGKTTTVTELILQAVKRGLRVLVCAPSNAAVDNIVERLSPVSMEKATGMAVQSEGDSKARGKKGRAKRAATVRAPALVRLGHPARMSDTIKPFCLEALVQNHDGTEIVGDVKAEMDSLRRESGLPKNRSKRREMRAQIKALRKEARSREENVVRSILRSRDVVLSTCVGAAHGLLRGMVQGAELAFDLCIIDEAAQALEASCWIPLSYCGKAVFAGDHCQLPPTIKSDRAVKGGLGVTLFERILNDIPATGRRKDEGNAGGGGGGGGGGAADEEGSLARYDRLSDCARLLAIQYRMNHDICSWASDAMYSGKLSSHQSVATHRLADLQGGKKEASRPSEPDSSENGLSQQDTEDEALSAVMLLLDTCGCDMFEDENEEETNRGSSRATSRQNEREVQLVAKHVKALLDPSRGGLTAAQVGVITPYNGQLRLLRDLLKPEHPGLDVKTVDSFQGGEKEAIVLSLVRSNLHGEVGFLADSRRINVAVTRARRHLCVVCDSETVSHDSFVGSLVSHISQQGLHVSAADYFDGEFGSDWAPGARAAPSGGGGARRQGKSKSKTKHEMRISDLVSIVKLFRDGDIGCGTLRHEPAASSEQGSSSRLPAGWFVDDGSPPPPGGLRSLRFPPTLTPRHRAEVHEAAEKLGTGRLVTKSEGEGSARAVVLSVAPHGHEHGHEQGHEHEQGQGPQTTVVPERGDEEGNEEESPHESESESGRGADGEGPEEQPTEPEPESNPEPDPGGPARGDPGGDPEVRAEVLVEENTGTVLTTSQASVEAAGSTGADIAAAVKKSSKSKSKGKKKKGGQADSQPQSVGHTIGHALEGAPLPLTHPSFRQRPPAAPPSIAISSQGGAADKGKDKGKGKGKTDSLVHSAPDELDDDALLALAIEESQAEACPQPHYSSKYRVGATAMPNYEKVQARDKVQARLREAADLRASQAVKEARDRQKEAETVHMRPPAGAYNGPQSAVKAKAAAVVERARAAAAARKAEKEKERSAT